MPHLESLVVFDPNSRTREALTFGFERLGLSVYATADAHHALSMAKTKVPQLFVSAVPDAGEAAAPPEPEAVALVGRLREDATTRELPIVVLGERGAREAALRAGADEFVARPAFIRDVITLSSLAVALRQDGDEAGVAGMLDDYELYFLTRALSVAERTGVLELERGDRSGEVHFVKGEVVTARCGRMTGLAAFHQLLLWGEAAMQLRLSTPTGERRIHVPMDALLADGARFAREFEAVCSRVGGAQAVYRQEPRRTIEARAQIPGEVVGMLRLFDGKRPLIDLVEDSPFKALDTLKVTWRLVELGVIERISVEAEPSPLTAELAVRDWLLGTKDDKAPRTTVTEAGRRAAEAYAEAAERKAAAPPTPAADLLEDTDRVRMLATVEAAPSRPKNGEGLGKRKKRKNKRDKTNRSSKAEPAEVAQPDVGAMTMVGDQTLPTPKLDLQPSQPEVPPPVVDLDATVPFSRMPLEIKEPAAPIAPATPSERPAPPWAAATAPSVAASVPVIVPVLPQVAARSGTIEVKDPAPVAAKAPAAAPAPAPVAAAAPPVAQPQTPSPPPSVKTTPAKLAAAAAKGAPAGRDPNRVVNTAGFTKVEEDFFAREEEFHTVQPVDTFEDLEKSKPHAKVEQETKRKWFQFGSRKFAAAPSPKAPPKKR